MLQIFYEIDLPDLLLAEDIESFLYFYAFFRRAAFEPGPLALEELLSASSEYSQQISENLRLQVYDALCDIAQGFLDYRQNQLTPTPETCRLLYGSALVLLYRLLFILYAEARGLLPLQENRHYKRNFSLDAIKKDAAQELKDGAVLDMSGIFWERIKTLFTSIREGNQTLGVNTFNGGLFATETNEFHTFLDNYAIGDHAICQAIDKLARVNEQYIDYRDLSERHLGTIYEGLLEYTLHVATEPMVELRSSSKIVPRQDVSQKDITKTYGIDQVYLVTDLGERKTTGSYYTPDYIVKYMVEQTVGTCLNEAITTLGDTSSDEEKIQAVLSIKVLDPAMGSGHFPVEAVEYVARYIVALDVQTDETDDANFAYWKRRAAQQCIYGIDINPLAVELAKLSLWLVTAAKGYPLNFLDHHLRPGNALVGSWLRDITKGFYRKMQQRVVTVEKAQEQKVKEEQEAVQDVPLIDMDAFQQDLIDATEKFTEIEHNPGDTVEDVKTQERAYKEISTAFKEKYLLLAQLKPALYYLGISDDLWNPLARFVMKNGGEQTPEITRTFQAIIDTAFALAGGKKRFLHWELEFPHLFYDRGKYLGEKAGFDVVIGNPPYVRQEQLSEDKPFYEDNYTVFQGTADLFVYFFEQGLQLLRRGGRLAYISSNTWLRTNSATKLRWTLKTQTTVETIIDLGNNRIFADAPDLTPSIQIIQKAQAVREHVADVAIFARGEHVKMFRSQLAEKFFLVPIHDQPDAGWQLKSDASRELFVRLMAQGTPLGKLIEGRMYRGVVTGLNAAFIINGATRDRLVNADPNSTQLIKSLVRGEDLRPWYQEDEGRWLIFAYRGINIDSYPAIKEHLQQFREQLEPRPQDMSNRETLAGRKSGSYKWYEIQDTVDYYKGFEKPKIFWADIAKYPRFSWDEKGYFSNDTGFFLPSIDQSLLGILQSRVTWFCISRLCPALAEREGLIIYRQKIQYIKHLPIPTLTDEQRVYISSLTRQITEVARQRYRVRYEMKQRIKSDLGLGQGNLTDRLEEWWNLSWQSFRDEIQKSFKRNIPLRERNEWEALLQEERTRINQYTAEIARLEQELNAAVEAVFGLSNEDVKLLEQETKYQYAEW